MNIFIMSESDIEEVKRIEKDCQVGSWSLQDYNDEIRRKDGLAFVVKEESQVIGFILARLITKSNIESISIGKKIMNLEAEIEIYNIAVKPNFQNQGIGQKLINQIISCTTNFQSRSIWLEVRKSNRKAIKFYEKNNFTKTFERRKFYSNPVEDGIVMKKSITNF